MALNGKPEIVRFYRNTVEAETLDELEKEVWELVPELLTLSEYLVNLEMTGSCNCGGGFSRPVATEVAPTSSCLTIRIKLTEYEFLSWSLRTRVI
ncbi:MAG: hypothetical protein PSV18_14480 [Methylobacter sp.]|nr:hypothetical protein [Candidatus Methylobacter titanis]